MSLDQQPGAAAVAQPALDDVARRRSAIAYASVVAENRELRRQLELRTWALNSAPSHFLIVDTQLPGSPIVFVNKALAINHGYEPDELIGESVAILAAPEENVAQYAAMRAAIKDGRDLKLEMTARRKDGSRFKVGIFVGPIRDAEGEVSYYVSVGADITVRQEAERKRQELQKRLEQEVQERERLSIELRLAQKLEAVGRLASGIAHEINTPIQYVGDSIYFLRTAVTDLQNLLQQYRATVQDLTHELSPVWETLQEAERAADLEFVNIEIPRAFERTLEGVARVTGIVRALKEFAHPDGEEQNLADINHALATTLTVARNEYKYIAAVNTDFGEIPPVNCNIGQLNQVFLNLIVNAAHAIEASGKDAATGCIDISTRQVGDHVEIGIADNGCGIPQNNLDKIFDPFFTTKEVGKGTGQGLAIARTIVVEKHSGDLLVQSTVNVGTRFVVRLPIGGRHSIQAGT